MHVVATEKVPIKIWANEVEETAMEQLRNAANLPFVFKHIAVMPDVHAGFGIPIGSVVPTKGTVIPSLVGVDIGCGVLSAKLVYTDGSPVIYNPTEDFSLIREKIKSKVPLGSTWNNEPFMFDDAFRNEIFNTTIFWRNVEDAAHQVGTLGGGNHFIELQRNIDDELYVMIHTGSRNVGKKVGDHYNKIAKELNAVWFSSVPIEWDLAFLPMYSDEGIDYWNEMQVCMRFAEINRTEILRAAVEVISEHLKVPITCSIIDTCHNFADLENHYGKNVVVHRKGAVRVRDGFGLIPGSQGSSSFIVKGRNNSMSFGSSSHGAGRVMGRKKAKENLVLEEEIAVLNEQGIIHGIKTVEDLDEATGAYKNIYDVMEQQKDLVEIVTELKPIFVIKG